jgi:hypothetical protein
MNDLSNDYPQVVEQLKSMLEKWQSDVNHDHEAYSSL